MLHVTNLQVLCLLVLGRVGTLTMQAQTADKAFMTFDLNGRNPSSNASGNAPV